jgi:hypothetical protein
LREKKGRRETERERDEGKQRGRAQGERKGGRMFGGRSVIRGGRGGNADERSTKANSCIVAFNKLARVHNHSFAAEHKDCPALYKK